MIELAEVFRRFAADYLSAHGASMLPSHRRAIEDILDCRTAALGGQLWHCDTCDTEMFSFHSCGNRSCPKCHTAQTQEWLERRQAEMLPVPYFHITVTVPAELREVLRTHQRDGYAVLMQATANAIIELARDPRYVGGTVGVLAVLHTWTQQLNFHPHVHCLVSGGGISEDGTTWHPARRNFLLPIKALAKLVRGKFRALLRRSCPDLVIPAPSGASLDPSRHRLGQRRTGRAGLPRPLRLSRRSHQRPHRWPRRRNRHHPIQGTQDRPPRTCRLSGDEFMRRFLQHVLPRGFHKVRYFGLWHPAQRHNAARVRQMLQLQAPPKLDPPQDLVGPPLVSRRRGTDAVDRAVDLSALSPGAADLHPQAHATAGHGTMIRRAHPHHHSVLLPRPPHATESRCHHRNNGPHLGHDDATDHPENAASRSMTLRSRPSDGASYRQPSAWAPMHPQ